MKRVLLEWGLLVSLGMFLALSTLWVVSRWGHVSPSHFTIATSRSVRDDLHMGVGNGDLWFCDQLDFDANGNVEPLVVDPRTHIAPRIRRIGHCTIPGFDLRYCRFAPDGYVEWSLRLSLLYPALLALLLSAALFRRRPRRSNG